MLDGRLLRTLHQESQLVRDEDLEQWSLIKIRELASHQPLPPIEPPGGRLPASVQVRVNRLYRGLANPDYTRRLRNFNRMFEELNMCTLALERQEQFQRLESHRASMRGAQRPPDTQQHSGELEATL